MLLEYLSMWLLLVLGIWNELSSGSLVRPTVLTSYAYNALNNQPYRRQQDKVSKLATFLIQKAHHYDRTKMFPLKFFVLRKLKSFHIHRTKTTSQQHDKKKTTTDNENKKKMWGITIGTLCLVLFRICLDTRLKVLLIALESFSTEKKKLYFQ